MQVADAVDTQSSAAQALARMHRLVDTPLTLGIGYAELLAEDPLLPEALRPKAYAILQHVLAVARRLHDCADVDTLEELADRSGRPG